MLRVTSRAFTNVFRAETSNYLLGVFGEKIVATTTIYVSWEAKASAVNTFTVTSLGGTLWKVARATGSFIDDEFSIGDTVKLNGDISSTIYNDASSAITELYSDYIVLNGGITDVGTSTDIVISGVTHCTAMSFKYGLIENEEQINFISLTDGNTQEWVAEGLTTTSGAITCSSVGKFNSWKTDSCTIEKQTDPIQANGYIQEYDIIHTFYITPFGLGYQIQDIVNGLPPEWFKDVASLKYVIGIEAKDSVYNPNTSHGGEDDLMLGSVGWLGENFNGFTPTEFSLDSITYEQDSAAVSSVQVNGVTSIEIKIDSLNNVFSSGNTKFTLNICYLPEDESEYIDTTTTLLENFVFDTILQTSGATGGAGDNGVFTNVQSSVVSNQLVINADIQYTSSQKTKITDGKYLIWVTTQDHTKATELSDKMPIRCDVDDYEISYDNPNLLTWNSVKLYEHPFNTANVLMGKKNFKGWISDGVYTYTDFTTNAGTINALDVMIRCRNTSTAEDFDMSIYSFNLTGNALINDIRQVDTDTTRGFRLVANSLRNLVKLEMGSTVSTSQQYLLQFALKLRFEDWIALVAANSDFWDSSKANNGLNQKWSNYFDNVADWKTELVIKALVEDSDGNVTIFENRSDIEIRNYGEDNNVIPLWTWEIETFEGVTSLGVSNEANNQNSAISKEENTKIIVTFTTTQTITVLASALYGVIMLGSYQKDGIYKQWQLSSLELPVNDNPLYPVAGSTYAKVTKVDTNNVTVECMINKDLLGEGDFSISARLGSNCEDSYSVAWVAQTSGVTDGIMGVNFYNELIGWACLYDSKMLYTNDGGTNWSIKNVGSVGIRDCSIIDDTTIWCCGNNFASKTVDSGANWVAKTLPSVVFWAISMITEDKGWCCGNSGKIVYTIDGFVSYAAQTTGITSNLHTIYFVNEYVGYCAGASGVILKTIDSGTTWTQLTTGLSNTFYDIYFVDENEGWACANNGVVIKTTDGGTTWTELTTDTLNTLYGISFINSSIGWVCGYNGELLKTTDGGLTWSDDSNGSTTHLRSIFAFDEDNAWTTGWSGIILALDTTLTMCDPFIPIVTNKYDINSSGDNLEINSSGDTLIYS